jgi:hypothetical protein
MILATLHAGLLVHDRDRTMAFYGDRLVLHMANRQICA